MRKQALRPIRARVPSIMIALVVSMSAGALSPIKSQSLTAADRDHGHVMLKTLKDEIKKNYYDPNFRGIDLDARFKTADEKVDRATSLGQVFGIIAQALLDFEDAHLFFIPPRRAATYDYCWQMQVVGDKCYVSAVKPGSDAEAKGLKPGDLVNAVDAFAPTRENLWKLKYLYYALRPQPGMRLIVQSPGSAERQVDIISTRKQRKLRIDIEGPGGANDFSDLIREGEDEDRLRRQRHYEIGDDLMIWKMPEFDLDAHGVDDLMSKANKRKALILDLRGNPGGAEETLKNLLGHFVDRDLKIGDAKRRRETKPIVARARGDRFKGKLVVLIDGESGSSAEIFARVVQLEKLGYVIGDRSAGAVMRARSLDLRMGADTVVFYGASITDADLIMTDGKSLEKTGVMPDELLLPTAADLASKRDPVLAHAAAIVGVKLDPEKAGSLFPVEWRQ